MAGRRTTCCDHSRLRTGRWSLEEDFRLTTFIRKHGHSNWRTLPKQAGLMRCGKSCRLRWINYLKPGVKRGSFTHEEISTIIRLHRTFGSKWSRIASHLPGRTDNEIKNLWNTHLAMKDPEQRNGYGSSDSLAGATILTPSSSSSSCVNEEEPKQIKESIGSSTPSPSSSTVTTNIDSDQVQESKIEVALECDFKFWDKLGNLTSI